MTGAPASSPTDAVLAAVWADRLCRAGVPWPTTRRLALAVRLAGLPVVRGLGEDVVEGDGASTVRALLTALAEHARPDEVLGRVARAQRLLAAAPPAGLGARDTAEAR